MGTPAIVTDRIRKVLRHAARAIILTVAVLYFLIDLIFLSVVRPLRRCLMGADVGQAIA
jgi:hypothetical protein